MAEKMTKVENWRRNVAYAIAKPHGIKAQVADAAEIDAVYLSKLLAGKRTPSLRVAVAISDAIGVKIDELLELPVRFKQLHPEYAEIQREAKRKKRGGSAA